MIERVRFGSALLSREKTFEALEEVRFEALEGVWRTERTQMVRKQTFQDWLEIHKDLDAYIARGGKLMELPVLDDASYKRLETLIADELGRSTNMRLARFFKSIMDAMDRKRPVGEVLTESKLLDLWHKTASNN